jgi:hypothetical protein
MAKSIAGVEMRKGSTVTIGDNRYGMREAYDPSADEATKKYYREADKLTIKEVKNPNQTVVKTVRVGK